MSVSRVSSSLTIFVKDELFSISTRSTSWKRKFNSTFSLSVISVLVTEELCGTSKTSALGPAHETVFVFSDLGINL